ncbi:MAG TPA: hypothetical protein VGM64_08010 [Lacunisphaera sp.]
MDRTRASGEWAMMICHLGRAGGTGLRPKIAAAGNFMPSRQADAVPVGLAASDGQVLIRSTK